MAFTGFPTTTTAADRLATMEKFVAEFRDFRPTGFSHNYKGPLDNQTLSGPSFVHFADRKSAAAFLQGVKTARRTELTVGSAKVRVQPALTKVQRAQRWSLDKAEQLLKKEAGEQTVEKVTRGDRCVKVGGAVAFEQPKGNPRGTFKPPFTHLSLPA